jgi:hypothetical protein
MNWDIHNDRTVVNKDDLSPEPDGSGDNASRGSAFIPADGNRSPSMQESQFKTNNRQDLDPKEPSVADTASLNRKRTIDAVGVNLALHNGILSLYNP